MGNAQIYSSGYGYSFSHVHFVVMMQVGQRHYYFMNIGNGEVIDACRKVRAGAGRWDETELGQQVAQELEAQSTGSRTQHGQWK